MDKATDSRIKTHIMYFDSQGGNYATWDEAVKDTETVLRYIERLGSKLGCKILAVAVISNAKVEEQNSANRNTKFGKRVFDLPTLEGWHCHYTLLVEKYATLQRNEALRNYVRKHLGENTEIRKCGSLQHFKLRAAYVMRQCTTYRKINSNDVEFVCKCGKDFIEQFENGRIKLGDKKGIFPQYSGMELNNDPQCFQ